MEKSRKDGIIRWYMVLDFIKKHRDAFSDYEVMAIKDIMLRGDFPDAFHYDLVREICDELGMIPEEDNIYNAFLDEIRNQFGIEDRHIIEVGGGMVPCLGKRINLMQNRGSLTVYDPRLLDDYQEKENFKLRRESFTHSTPVEGTDLIIGLMPCGGTDVLIDQAIKNRIDFMVWLCEGGPHGDCFDYFESDEEWLSSTINYTSRRVLENGMDCLTLKYKKKFSEEYPIIYSKKIN